MRFGAGFWIQRTSWPALRDACVEAEAAGFDTIWLDDHLLADEGDWHDAKLEGWSALAAVAAVTKRARLGLLVSANTFRNPGLTAKLATTLDHVSEGRAILGIGGGWFEREHDAFGIDFGSGFGERLDRLDEAVMLIRRLLDGERVTHEGRFYQFHDAVCEPRPLQQHLPILIGGSGPKKTLRTTARYADLWNGFGSVDRVAGTSDVLRERCAEEGRPFEAIERTVTMDVVIRDDAAAAERTYDEIAARHGLRGEAGSDGSARGLNAWGPPEAVADYVRGFAEIGVAEVIWVFRDPFDVETMRRMADVRLALVDHDSRSHSAR
ncbi:MAG TPA: TIGR03560 family F420-dependent LLM class oxidoreductase [Candidatus Limnocylindrales bacterium]|nr:TIGR03560 family F420-dependent LLM class oxidoreductase [Candidatus Limnocylindrales bacterium]